MIKVGIVGPSFEWHMFHFTCIMNGYEYDLAIQEGKGVPRLHLGEMRVTRIFDPNIENAKRLAKICQIDNVCTELDDVAEGVDAVLIVDDTTYQHQKRAPRFIKRGIPVFIDKPLSTEMDEALEILSLVEKHNSYFMSCSALRYAREAEEFKKELERSGDQIVTAHSFAPFELVTYGIHAWEFLYPFFGPGVKSVCNLGKERSDIVVVKFKDGRNCCFQVAEAAYRLGGTFYCEKEAHVVPVSDSDYFYWNMLRHFAVGLDKNELPIPLEETRELIRTLILARQSREEGREIEL